MRDTGRQLGTVVRHHQMVAGQWGTVLKYTQKKTLPSVSKDNLEQGDSWGTLEDGWETG